VKRFFQHITLFLLIVSTVSCGKVSTLEFKPAPVTLTAEGPLFEGSNTAQGVLLNAELEALLAKGGYRGAAVKSARLVSAQIFTEADTLTLDNLSEITLQLAAPDVDMQKVAVLNPVPAGSKSAALQVAGEQEKIAKLLLQPALTLVADVNLKQDAEATLAVKCQLVFEINVKD
jgi:hypothetical protein